MNKEREIDEIKIVVNGEQYEAYKGTLQDEIKKQNKYIKMLLNNIEKLVEENGEKAGKINKAINYIETKSEKQYGFNFEYNLKETEIQDLLDILKGE